MKALLYGIKNCDTMKKARVWLDDNGVAYEFHDYKASGIDHARLERWCTARGWETLLNRVGTTFRALPEEARQVSDQDAAIALMLAHPSMIKRPVLEHDGEVLVGFKLDNYAKYFGRQA
ncbi:MAG: ArsC family reductase [Burkholderiales bacterium]|nr:ArsC family reductase [Burkholderiales bacterium]